MKESLIFSEEAIKEIRERANKATRPPWQAVHAPACITLNLDASMNANSLRVAADCGSQFGLIPQGVLFAPDAEFVAHARDDVPALCASLLYALESAAHFAHCRTCGEESISRCDEGGRSMAIKLGLYVPDPDEVSSSDE